MSPVSAIRAAALAVAACALVAQSARAQRVVGPSYGGFAVGVTVGAGGLGALVAGSWLRELAPRLALGAELQMQSALALPGINSPSAPASPSTVEEPTGQGLLGATAVVEGFEAPERGGAFLRLGAGIGAFLAKPPNRGTLHPLLTASTGLGFPLGLMTLRLEVRYTFVEEAGPDQSIWAGAIGIHW